MTRTRPNPMAHFGRSGSGDPYGDWMDRVNPFVPADHPSQKRHYEAQLVDDALRAGDPDHLDPDLLRIAAAIRVGETGATG